MNSAQMLAMLRHAYEQLRTPGAVEDQSRFADGLIAPVIRALEHSSRRECQCIQATVVKP